jgi:thioredoxin 1
MGSLLEVNDSTFEEEVVKSDKPVLVDFWAPWCAPCHMLTPTIEELAEEYDDKYKVFKLNVDESPQTAARFGVMSIPTLILFKEGEAKDLIVGANNSKDSLKKKMDALL